MPPGKKLKAEASSAATESDTVESQALTILRTDFYQAFENLTFDFGKIIKNNDKVAANTSGIQQRFKAFCKEEVKLSGLPMHRLTQPCGDFETATGGLLLHWPTFTTTSDISCIRDMADPGNPCLRQLFKKGLTTIDTVWTDLYLRRLKMLPKGQRHMSPMQKNWSQELLEVHESYTYGLIFRECSHIRIWTVFGKHVKEWLESVLSSRGNTCYKFDFGLVNGFFQISADRCVERIFIHSFHPMYAFYSAGVVDKGARMDAAINLFAALTHKEVDETYFDIFHRSLMRQPAPAQPSITPFMQTSTTILARAQRVPTIQGTPARKSAVSSTKPTPAPARNSPVLSAKPTPAPAQKSPISSAKPTPAPARKSPVSSAKPTSAPAQKSPVLSAKPTPATEQISTGRPSKETERSLTISRTAKYTAEDELVKNDPHNAQHKAALLELLANLDDGIAFAALPTELLHWLSGQGVRSQAQAEQWATNIGANKELEWFDAAVIKLMALYEQAVVKDKYAAEWAKRMKASTYSKIYVAPDPANNRPPSVVVWCKTCKSKRTDYHPNWLNTGHYLVGKMACYGCGRQKTGKEKGRIQRRHLWPVSKTIKAIDGNAMKAIFFRQFPDADGAAAFKDWQKREKARNR